jgi:hypothetical protein
MFRLMVADLDSPSYFVAVAAVELGFFKHEGIDIELERTYGAHNGAERLRDGTLHFFGGPAYAATLTFPAWKGAKLLCALSQYSYWFLAVRADLAVERGDLSALKGLRISSSMAAPVLGLRHLLAESGIDFERDNVRIVPAPPSKDGRWMGHAGVDAITQGLADAYWGNGMRVAMGEKLGVAKLHLDIRRGDGPAGAPTGDTPEWPDERMGELLSQPVAPPGRRRRRRLRTGFCHWPLYGRGRRPHAPAGRRATSPGTSISSAKPVGYVFDQGLPPADSRHVR